MGYIRSEYGKVSLEARIESFKIHIKGNKTDIELDFGDVQHLIDALNDMKYEDARFNYWYSKGWA